MSVDATADLYTEHPEGLRWLGSLSVDGDPDSLAAVGLFRPHGLGDHGLSTFRHTALRILDYYVDNDRGYSAAHGDPWPWPWSHSGASGGTDYAYVYHAGHLRVYGRRPDRDGLYQLATHMLHLPARPQPFPILGGQNA